MNPTAPEVGIPDAYFYYALSIILFITLISLLIWMGKRFIQSYDKLCGDVVDLKEGRKDHDIRIRVLEDKVLPSPKGFAGPLTDWEK